MANKVKELLKEGRPVIGAWVTIGHPDIVEVLATLPFDWLLFDMEHAPLDISTLQIMLPALKGSDITPFVRVPWNDPVIIKRALDLGFKGILIPWVNSKEEAKKAVKACHYPPHGVRGVGPRRATFYGSLDVVNYFHKFEKEDLIIAIQIETQKALDDIYEILSVKGIDIAFIGPNDLSASLGIFRQFNSPKFKNALNKVLRACEELNVVAGIFTMSAKEAKMRIAEGFKFIALAHDYSMLRNAYIRELKEVRSITYRE